MGLARAAYERCVLLSGLALLAGLCLAWTPLALLLSLVLPRAAGRRIGRRAIHTGCAFYLRALAATGTCRFDLAALEALEHEGPLIIAPNHPGLLDAVLVLSRLRDVSCIAKGPLLRSPLFGAGARLAGYLSNASPLGMAVQAADELHGGGKLLLFPEGTRTVRPPVNRRE